jgi:hypothetical protein
MPSEQIGLARILESVLRFCRNTYNSDRPRAAVRHGAVHRSCSAHLQIQAPNRA